MHLSSSCCVLAGGAPAISLIVASCRNNLGDEKITSIMLVERKKCLCVVRKKERNCQCGEAVARNEVRGGSREMERALSSKIHHASHRHAILSLAHVVALLLL